MPQLALYSPLSKWNKADRPLSPFVYLSLGIDLSEHDGHILLSAQLMTPEEIDYAVAQLKTELDDFQIAAKKELQKLREKMLQK
jgi:hypothetical protein